MKQENIIRWNNALKARKQRFWHALMNGNKAILYKKWSHETPDFIPRKFRPKFVQGEDPEITKLKIDRAKQDFRSNIHELETFSKIHQDKLGIIEEDMAQHIIDISPNNEVHGQLTELWRTEAAENEEKSVQIWNVKERFLNKKRHEEILSNNYLLADETWQELLQNRGLKQKKKIKRQASSGPNEDRR